MQDWSEAKQLWNGILLIDYIISHYMKSYVIAHNFVLKSFMWWNITGNIMMLWLYVQKQHLPLPLSNVPCKGPF